MVSRPWYFVLGQLLPPEFPAIARLFLAALSGAILSLSYYGAHPSFYSWFCLAILLFSLLGARARVAFFCGLLARPDFCPHLRPVGRGSALRSWRHVCRSGLGGFAAHRHRVGMLDRSFRLDGAAVVAAGNRPRSFWRSVPLDFHGSFSRLSSGNQFSLGIARLSRRGKSRPRAAHDDHRNLWRFVSRSRIQFASSLDSRESVRKEAKQVGGRRHRSCDSSRRANFGTTLRSHCFSQPCRARRSAKFSGKYAIRRRLVRRAQSRHGGTRAAQFAAFARTRSSRTSSSGPKRPLPFLFRIRDFGPYISRLATEFQHPVVVGIIDWKPITRKREGNSPHRTCALQQRGGAQ